MPVPDIRIFDIGVDFAQYLDRVSPEGRIVAKYGAMGGAAHFGPYVYKTPGAWFFRLTIDYGPADTEAIDTSAIVDNPDDLLAHEIHGHVLLKWEELGGVDFALPTSDSSRASDGIGRVCHFDTAGVSILWLPSAGAFSVIGGIRALYLSLGGEGSALGYPTGEQNLSTTTEYLTNGTSREVLDNGLVQFFQHGLIFDRPGTGTTVQYY